MKVTANLILCFAVCLLLVSSSLAQKPAAKPFFTSGYYDGIKMTSKESGDYGGISVFLTQSDSQTFALVTTAAGAIFDPVLVEAKVTGKDMRTIEFTLPNENGNRKFTGTVSATGLTLNEDGTKTTLKRGCANAYSDISAGTGGDYGGTEVYITDSGGSWFALVTIAEGVLRPPVLVKADVTGKEYDKIAFTLPGDNGGRKFMGTIGKTALTLNEGGTRTILKAKCYK